MRIAFKLRASLTDCLPAEHRTGNLILLDVGSGATIVTVIAPFNLTMKPLHLVLTSGVFVPPELRATRQMVEDGVPAIWPPIAGG